MLSVSMNEETLIAYCKAYNGVKTPECAPEESITKDLLTSCRHAYKKYQMRLDEKKKKKKLMQKRKQNKVFVKN